MGMKTTILVADDNEAVSVIVACALKPAGYEIVRAFTGAEALAAAAREAPDLVILDVRMPGLSGWEVLASLRESAATRTVPVVMLTGCGGTDNVVDGLGRGADDYVTKPFSMDELRARVSRLLARRREARV
jgi:two-component system OmpR family response regulator